MGEWLSLKGIILPMTPHLVKLHNYQLQVTNLKEYHQLKREIFTQNHYYFETSNPKPLILDLGAHLGLTTLYFKRLYPGSLIHAFEPHPKAFSLLTSNLNLNHLTGIYPHPQAVWSHTGPLTLYADPSPEPWLSNTSIQSGFWDQTQLTQPLQVTTTTLAAITQSLNRPISLAKIDLEGAEAPVLFSSYSHFNHIHRYVVEFHPSKTTNLRSFIRHFPSNFHLQIFKRGQPANLKNPPGGLITIWATKSP